MSKYYLIRVSRFLFPALENPHAAPVEGAVSRFAVSVPVDEVPEELALQIPEAVTAARRSSFQCVTFRTPIKPPVYGQEPDNSDLEPLRRHCYLTGFCFDTLIRNMPGEVLVKTCESDRRGRYAAPTAATLIAVRLNPPTVRFPGWAEVVEHTMGKDVQ